MVVWLAFLPVLLLHTLFVVTYPLNNLGGDTSNYFDMIVRWRSSLVHAGGYPFLVGLPFRFWPLSSLAGATPRIFETLLLIVQHAIPVGAMVAMYHSVGRLYGAAAALISTLLFGTSLQFMGAASSAYPEWLQASLFVFAVCSAARAYHHQPGTRKAVWYAASVSAFTWCVLTKFNAAVMVIGYLLPLAAERMSYWRILRWAAGLAVVAALNLAIYLTLFHYPSTGSYRLTADTGWVLLTKIQHTYGNELMPDAGRSTRRWLVLGTMLPKRYDFAGPGMFSHVNAVPSEVRAPYRQLFRRVMTAEDSALDELLHRRRLPEGFSVGVSVIPVCYYVGLFEGSDLGVKVAREAMRARPRQYLDSVLQDVRRALTTYEVYQLFPGENNLTSFRFRKTDASRNGMVRLIQPQGLESIPYGYRNPVVWWPGVRLFGWIQRIEVPAFVFTALIAIAVAVALLKTIASRKPDAASAVTVMLAICVSTFVLTSSATLAFRWKEFCFVMPIVWVLAGAGLTWAPREARNVFRQLISA